MAAAAKTAIKSEVNKILDSGLHEDSIFSLLLLIKAAGEKEKQVIVSVIAEIMKDGRAETPDASQETPRFSHLNTSLKLAMSKHKPLLQRVIASPRPVLHFLRSEAVDHRRAAGEVLAAISAYEYKDASFLAVEGSAEIVKSYLRNLMREGHDHEELKYALETLSNFWRSRRGFFFVTPEYIGPDLVRCARRVYPKTPRATNFGVWSGAPDSALTTDLALTVLCQLTKAYPRWMSNCPGILDDIKRVLSDGSTADQKKALEMLSKICKYEVHQAVLIHPDLVFFNTLLRLFRISQLQDDVIKILCELVSLPEDNMHHPTLRVMVAGLTNADIELLWIVFLENVDQDRYPEALQAMRLLRKLNSRLFGLDRRFTRLIKQIGEEDNCCQALMKMLSMVQDRSSRDYMLRRIYLHGASLKNRRHQELPLEREDLEFFVRFLHRIDPLGVGSAYATQRIFDILILAFNSRSTLYNTTEELVDLFLRSILLYLFISEQNGLGSAQELCYKLIGRASSAVSESLSAPLLHPELFSHFITFLLRKPTIALKILKNWKLKGLIPDYAMKAIFGHLPHLLATHKGQARLDLLEAINMFLNPRVATDTQTMALSRSVTTTSSYLPEVAMTAFIACITARERSNFTTMVAYFVSDYILSAAGLTVPGTPPQSATGHAARGSPKQSPSSWERVSLNLLPGSIGLWAPLDGDAARAAEAGAAGDEAEVEAGAAGAGDGAGVDGAGAAGDGAEVDEAEAAGAGDGTAGDGAGVDGANLMYETATRVATSGAGTEEDEASAVFFALTGVAGASDRYLPKTLQGKGLWHLLNEAADGAANGAVVTQRMHDKVAAHVATSGAGAEEDEASAVFFALTGQTDKKLTSPSAGQ